MTKQILSAIDWTSIRLNAVALLGFMSHDDIVFFLTCIATISTIVYNAIKIKKVLINKQQTNDKQ